MSTKAIRFRIPYHASADRYRRQLEMRGPAQAMRLMDNAVEYQDMLVRAAAVACGLTVQGARTLMRNQTHIICTPAQFGILMAMRARLGKLSQYTIERMEIEFVDDESVPGGYKMTHYFLTEASAPNLVSVPGLLNGPWTELDLLAKAVGMDRGDFLLARQHNPNPHVEVVMTQDQFMRVALTLERSYHPKLFIYEPPKDYDARPNGTRWPR